MSSASQSAVPRASHQAPRVAIIGAGVAGLCTAIQLRKAGIGQFTIFEKSDGVGGTWRDNSYPGCACDVPSHLYSYSFGINPEWTHKYSPQPEILRYLEQCTDKFGLRGHIKTKTAVTSARFDTTSGTWKIKTDTGEDFEAEVLVSGVGQLNRPSIPAFTGLADFAGCTFHSARWDHSVDLAGKRVAVVGNGASAVQFIPEIAKTALQLTVFQRSANWIVPRNDYAYPKWAREMFHEMPFLSRVYRSYLYWMLEKNFMAFIKDHWFGKLFDKAARDHLAAQVPDAALRAKLTPDYTIGCKRILIADDYLPVFSRPNVELVTERLSRFTANGIETEDGKAREFDVVIFATGFETTSFLAPIDIRGLNGRALADAWRGGPEAYMGVTVPGFPNFFLLYGPNTNLGHNSIIFMIEAQVRYVLQCIKEMMNRDLAYLDVKPQAMAVFAARVQAELSKRVWAAGCSSWYKTADGHITNNWSGPTIKYWQMMRRPDFSAYDAQARV